MSAGAGAWLAGQARALEAALKVLEGEGARIVDVQMPDVSDVVQYWGVICGHEMAVAHAATFPARAAEYGPYLRAMLTGGGGVTPEQLAAARRRQATLTAQLTSCSPRSTSWPVRRATARPGRSPTPCGWGRSTTTIGPGARPSQFMMPGDLAGVPAICVPCGFSDDGLPLLGSEPTSSKNYGDQELW